MEPSQRDQAVAAPLGGDSFTKNVEAITGRTLGRPTPEQERERMGYVSHDLKGAERRGRLRLFRIASYPNPDLPIPTGIWEQR